MPVSRLDVVGPTGICGMSRINCFFEDVYRILEVSENVIVRNGSECSVNGLTFLIAWSELNLSFFFFSLHDCYEWRCVLNFLGFFCYESNSLVCVWLRCLFCLFDFLFVFNLLMAKGFFFIYITKYRTAVGD